MSNDFDLVSDHSDHTVVDKVRSERPNVTGLAGVQIDRYCKDCEVYLDE